MAFASATTMSNTGFGGNGLFGSASAPAKAEKKEEAHKPTSADWDLFDAPP